ncbi:hypothetical protein LP419_31755 [Massilia sp. H-1]|nr:hypothetical protein LP419_31755 [Massilia sp. H-1]
MAARPSASKAIDDSSGHLRRSRGHELAIEIGIARAAHAAQIDFDKIGAHIHGIAGHIGIDDQRLEQAAIGKVQIAEAKYDPAAP